MGEEYLSAERARGIRKQYEEKKKEEAFEAAASTEAFTDILENIENAASAGKTCIEFMPHSEAFYVQKLNQDGCLLEEYADFSEEEIAAYYALRQLGYTVNIIKAKEAVGNASVILPGMNPMQGGMQIARCRIVWG